MKNKEKINLLILCGLLFLSACGASDEPQAYGESVQYDWEWVIEPGEYEDFTFLGGTYIAVKKENGKYSVIDEKFSILMKTVTG